MQVAKAALPQLLQRAERMLSSHSASTSAPQSAAEEEASMEDFQCMLEVLQALTVSPAITDAVLPPSGPIKVPLMLLLVFCRL
jgi:hypothetical protein